MENDNTYNFNGPNAITLPVSKSIGARFLVASFFAGTLPTEPLFDDCDDLEVLQEALTEIFTEEEPIDFGGSPLDVHSSGTALRFVTAVCASTPDADYVVTGSRYLCSRPMTPLLDVLHQAGAEINPQGNEGKGPYRIRGKKLAGGVFEIRGDISSQFISALMLVAPSWDKGMKLTLLPPIVSRPYIDMTANIMKSFNISLRLTSSTITVEKGDYKDPGDFKFEADWSAAAFFYEASSLINKAVILRDLYSPDTSIQGDSRIVEIFRFLGVSTSFSDKGAILSKNGNKTMHLELNLTDNPDLVPALTVACLLNDVKFNFSGIGNLKYKETDRIAALTKETKKIGFILAYDNNSLSWEGEMKEISSSAIDTYNDHRIAMAFAPVALKTGEIKISRPSVVEKSFFHFWDELTKLGLQCDYDEGEDVMTVKKVVLS